MPRTVTKSVFQFDELSDAAKETAREWMREMQAQDSDWYDSVYDDADTIAALMGIEIDRKPVKLMNGSTRYDPAIYFSGFSSQGDGACFEGRYAYAKGGAAKVRAHADDAKLHAIVDALQAAQKAHGYKLAARVTHSGYYYHAYSTDVEVFKGGGYAPDDVATEVKERLRDFMNWIYSQLQAEDEYRNDDEQIDDNIRANEYEFEADGSRTRD